MIRWRGLGFKSALAEQVPGQRCISHRHLTQPAAVSMAGHDPPPALSPWLATIRCRPHGWPQSTAGPMAGHYSPPATIHHPPHPHGWPRSAADHDPLPASSPWPASIRCRPHGWPWSTAGLVPMADHNPLLSPWPATVRRWHDGAVVCVAQQSDLPLRRIRIIPSWR